MNKTMEIRHPSALPLYGAGLVWLLGALLFPIDQLWAFLLTAALSVVAGLVLRRVCPGRVETIEVPVSTGDAERDAMIASVEKNRAALHAINERIPDDVLSSAILRMEKACDGILESCLSDGGCDDRTLRRFAKYYLPDAVKILDLYAELDEKGVSGENAAEVRREVEENAQVIASAFEKQLDGLYSARAMDISTDLDVLKGMLKGQGLVDD